MLYVVILTNEQVILSFPELSWTLQIIHDSTGERVPHYRDVNGRYVTLGFGY